MAKSKESGNERTNKSFRVREVYGWGRIKAAERLGVTYKSIQRRETWDEEKGKWEQPIQGESLRLHELLLALSQLGASWIAERVTSEAWSMESLRQELVEKGGTPVLELDRIIMVIDELVDQLRALPSVNQNLRFNSVQRLREALMSLRDERVEMREMADEDPPDDDSKDK